MPDGISLRLDDRELRRNMRRLTDQEIREWAARTINKLAFEVLDAEKAHAKDVFRFAGPATELFMAGRGAFRFTPATPRLPEAHIFPQPGPEQRRAAIFESQQRGGFFRATDPGRFEIEGKVAVPVLKSRGASPAGLRRTRRGLVRRISRGKAKSFIASGAVLERATSGRRGQPKALRILFALVPQVKISPRFDFYRVAREIAIRKLPEKAKREFERIRVARRR